MVSYANPGLFEVTKCWGSCLTTSLRFGNYFNQLMAESINALITEKLADDFGVIA